MGVWRRQHAAHRRVSHAAVAKALATGWIIAEPDGSIDPVKTDQQWDAATDPAKQRGVHARQLVRNDGTGASTQSDLGASFAVATGGVLTLFFAASPNCGSVRARVVDELSCAVFEPEIAAELPSTAQFMSPRLFLSIGRHNDDRGLRLLAGLPFGRLLNRRTAKGGT